MSTQGPKLEKLGISSSMAEAPTVTASSEPAGEALQASAWSFPDVEAF